MTRKRAKTSLPGMPMDIIFEIFGHLEPFDLLQLARTTKALRAVLMSRSSLSLWKRVRHAYHQMPDGPEGMSEPHYACLAFDDICFGCASPPSDIFVRTLWNAQLRSCLHCESVLLVNQPKLRKIKSSKALPPSFIALLESSDGEFRYSLKQVQLWLQQYGSSSVSSSAKLKWEAQVLKEDTLIRQHRLLYNTWRCARQREEEAQRRRVTEDMRKKLIIKLGEIGWAEEIYKMPGYERYQLENKLFIKDPTTFVQAWSLNARAIVESLKAVRAGRLEGDWKALLSSRYDVLRRVYDEYIHGLPADTLIPNIADVALFPPVHALLTDERSDFTITRETFENINLLQTLPSIVSDWKTRLEDELIQMMQVTLSESFTKDHLLLATTIFYCDVCNMNLFYPQVLVHQCSTPYSEWHKVEPVDCSAWNSAGNIKFDRNIHQAAIDIIDVLGLDPKVVTAEDMAARNSVLQCLDCRKTRQGRMTMVWSRAIDHSRNEHNCRPAMVSWKVPGHQGQLTLQASLARELAASDRSTDLALPRFMCGRCRKKATLIVLKNHHLLTVHKIRDPGNDDILLHPDGIHAPLPSVLSEVD